MKKNDKILNIFLLYIILQPFFDILSFLSIRDIIPLNISTYVKPLFIFSLGFYLLLKKCPNRREWLIYIILFIILAGGHTYLLYRLLVSNSMILHEVRFLINIAYMIALFIITSIIVREYPDKQELLRKLKKTVLITFLIYFSLLLLAIVTGTSANTYEYADSSKLGYKGWFDSGQILGHAFSIIFPVLIYVILSPKRKWYFRMVILLLFIGGVSLIGTKVPYYITLIVCILYLVISIFIKLFNKEHQMNYFNIVVVGMIVIGMFLTYQYTPVKYNTDINNRNANTGISDYDLGNESGMNEIKTIEELKKQYPGKDISELMKYQEWNKLSSEYLEELFESERLHPSNMRFKQIYYAHKKFTLADIRYKIFGLGFLNQDTSLALESDFFMALYSFGILGFLLFLIIPLKEFIKSTIFILKNLRIIDLETYMLYMGLGVFFCISIYAGYTFIYTNFSIFLVILLAMLNIKRHLLREKTLDSKGVDFLLLHLGYGGIETSVINTVNSLCKYKDITLISFYNLEKNQVKRIDKRIKIKYLYEGEPNKEEIKICIKDRNIYGIIREGLKSIDILIKKKLLIIREIRRSKSLYIVSTRWEFSVLLSKYGVDGAVKIAQEHHYHNNNKKYIGVIKHKYHKIDYLLALTKTLEDDYKKFLVNNYHTRVVLIPNMLDYIPSKKSTLDKMEIISVGRLDSGKKNDDIIRAFSKIKNHNWYLRILGDGVEMDNLDQLIQELNLEDRVILEGYVPKERLEDYYLQASLFLMASLTEGLPMVLLEAMSYGIPCIAYETASGVNDIIIDGVNGYVIKDRNIDEYVKRIDMVTGDSKLRKKLGKNTDKTLEKYKKDVIIDKWMELFKG